MVGLSFNFVKLLPGKGGDSARRWTDGQAEAGVARLEQHVTAAEAGQGAEALHALDFRRGRFRERLFGARFEGVVDGGNSRWP